ncbi:MAG TPA: hypothetical protein VK416_03140, partial [Thermoanaerobaculia bacterium]|nr:hypothetical protein [Thermoanaerobaculia bacterium]
ARLCADPWAGEQTKPDCLDWAAWSALAGDHSCSSADLLATVLEKPWTPAVARAAATLRTGLATARNENERRNRLTRSDLELERVDPEYSTRAGANNAHFLLARDTDDVRVAIMAAIQGGAELNALGIWVRAHLAALRLAAAWAADTIPEAERPAAARALLAAEAFGDHFLEDAFAAGHVAGTWGDTATRKGTHDYYNVHGLDARDWSGRSFILYGDAHMRDADRARAAAAVKETLDQVLDALAPGDIAKSAEAIPLDWAAGFASFDACRLVKMTAMPELPEAIATSMTKVGLATPVPGRLPPDAALPRFRSEIGPFLGLGSGLRGGGASGGVDSTTPNARITGAIDVGVRVGVGLEGVLGDAGDGQIFLQAGFLQQVAKKSSCEAECTTAGIAAGIALKTPARSAISTRLRLPFWLLPGDLILAAPVLIPFAPKTYEKMAIRATDGGVIPWQTGLSTFLGRVQFVAGREMGVSFYGYWGGEDQVFVVSPGSSGHSTVTAVSLRTIEFDFPIVEIRPFRGYATSQAAALLIQIGMGFERATKVTPIAPPGAVAPNIATPVFGYVRLAFDWRYYLGSGP